MSPQLLAGLAGLAGTTEQPRLMGIGWATVDLERTLAGLDGTNARVTDDDLLLGARAWRVDAGPVALVLLEPNTEGRLAAALAREARGSRPCISGPKVRPPARGGALRPHRTRPAWPSVVPAAPGGRS